MSGAPSRGAAPAYSGPLWQPGQVTEYRDGAGHAEWGAPTVRGQQRPVAELPTGARQPLLLPIPVPKLKQWGPPQDTWSGLQLHAHLPRAWRAPAPACLPPPSWPAR